MPLFKPAALLLSAALATSGCGALLNSDRTIDRTRLLNSAGPELTESEIAKYQQGIFMLRRFGPNYKPADEDNAEYRPPLSADDSKADPTCVDTATAKCATINDLQIARQGAFGFIETRCRAYLDAIFWARRSQRAGVNLLGAGAGGTAAILGATGATAKTLSIVAASFGLGSELFDETYEFYLYGLEPSSLVKVLDTAAAKYRTESITREVSSEAMLLRQVQGYIMQCTPVKLEALANELIDQGARAATINTPLSAAEFGKLEELAKKERSAKLTGTEALMLAELTRRYLTAGAGGARALAIGKAEEGDDKKE